MIYLRNNYHRILYLKLIRHNFNDIVFKYNLFVYEKLFFFFLLVLSLIYSNFVIYR